MSLASASTVCASLVSMTSCSFLAATTPSTFRSYARWLSVPPDLSLQAAQTGPDARRRPKAAREAYSLYVERAAEGVNEADGPVSAVCLQVFRRPHDGAPHVRRRARVEAQPFLGLLEVPADDVRELLELHLHGRVERVEVVHADQPRGHVPLVVAGVLVVALDVGLDPVAGAEERDVHVRVAIADRLVGEEPQRLVRSDGPAHFLVDVRLEQLRGPVAVVAADEPGDGDVVDEAGHDDFVAGAVLHGQARALHHVVGRTEAV